jgi:hypothetical protein
MLRTYCLVAGMGISVAGSLTYGQGLSSPRAIGIAAYGPLANDSREFLANPAGLVGMRDWNIATSTYTGTTAMSNGFVFHGIVLGKRFLEDHALAFQYSPGALMQFVVPTSDIISTNPTSVDKRVEYSEQFSFGYGVRLTSFLSAGLAGRFRKEKVTETQYRLVQDSVNYIERLNDRKDEVTSLLLDLGVQAKLSPVVTLSIVGRNLPGLKKDLPDEFERFQLPKQTSLDVGVAYQVTPHLATALEISTTQTSRLGCEWVTGIDVPLRGGLYLSNHETPLLSAFGVGVGWTYELLELDASYIHFLNQDNRRGSTAAGSFTPENLRSVELNPYTSDRFSVSLKAVFGNVHPALLRIEDVRIAEAVYPVSSEVYSFRSFGSVKVKNLSTKPVEAKVGFFIEKYMDGPTESPGVYLVPGETQEVPLTAVFNELVKKIPAMVVRDASVVVSSSATSRSDDKAQTKVVIRGRNDWDGDATSLRYFVTPDDPAVLRYSRDVLLEHKDSLAGVPRALEDFHKARLLFTTFAGKLIYVNDPKQSADYVQYPVETLQLRGGDCDDMTVCFSSLLNSIGISTAFIDVVPPDMPDKSHVYLMFDTGLDPKFGENISENPKRYVIRKNERGSETVWVPIETTVITKGFEEAWATGAKAYFEDVEVKLGLVKGWVRILDVY